MASAAVTSTALVTTVPTLYTRILSLFPQQYFSYCFGYGSGVFKQGGISTSKPMIDMIFVVDDTVRFHRQNIKKNPLHYSGLKYFGHNFVAAVQEKWPAKVYFNTLIPVPEEDIVLKYGVVSKEDFINDLLDWNYLYLAGRLHKPVQVVLPTVDNDFKSYLKLNLFSALHAAFLILPEFFSERQLYWTIANLSYAGDFRMIFGEDKNKVKNIVDPQVQVFKTLYAPLLARLSDYVEIPDDDCVDQACMQDMSNITRAFHLYHLPREPQILVTKYWHKTSGTRIHDTEEILRLIAYNPALGSILQNCIKSIVFNSSALQSLKGIFTAGLFKSISYSNKKIVKMVKSAKTFS